MNVILTGKTEIHLIKDEPSQLLVNIDMLEALNGLRDAAAAEGFHLMIESAFRGFDHQLRIWNAKARGERPLFNDQGIAQDYSKLSPKEILYAILRWSALPGASRHHWGTDIDVYDQSRMPEGYKAQLLPQESLPGGVFYEFHQWLNGSLKDYDFFRPYAADLGGIAPESWHISYAPISNVYQKNLTFELIEQTILETDIELKSIILQELPEIYRRFINI